MNPENKTRTSRILNRWFAGDLLKHIAERENLDASTVSKIIARARTHGDLRAVYRRKEYRLQRTTCCPACGASIFDHGVSHGKPPIPNSTPIQLSLPL